MAKHIQTSRATPQVKSSAKQSRPLSKQAQAKVKLAPALKSPGRLSASAQRSKGKKAKPPDQPSRNRVAAILETLAKTYPNAVCALNHHNAFELTIATILSAQTTDVAVNKVTPELFKMYPTPRKLAEAPLAELERIVHTTGFYRAKAKNIQGAARVLVEEFGGKVPQTIQELTRLPGVARKTANVVLGSWFAIASGIVVDTHVGRLSRRLELTQQTDPVKVEQDLEKVIPEDHWIQFSHELIHHGRQICIARKPHCADCPLEPLCHAADKTWSSHGPKLSA